MSTKENEKPQRPETMKGLLEDALACHEGERRGRAAYVEREGETAICFGCYGKIEPEKAVPFCESCRFDGHDRVHALCEEVSRLRRLVDEDDKVR